MRDKEKQRIYIRDWKRRNKTKMAEAKLKARYGMSLAEYNSMLSEQRNCCAICDRNVKELTKKLSVDHCHTTGKNRQLLCQNCNMALGVIEMKADMLKRFENYLKFHGDLK